VLGGLLAVAFSLVLVSYGLYARGILPSTFSSQWFLLLILLMGYELSVDVLRAGQLSRDLLESQQRMRLAATAADLSLWDWDLIRDEIWTTEKGRERAGIGASERINFARYLQSVHPDDRERTQRAVRHALEGNGEFEAEYRVTARDSAPLWVVARGQVEFDAQGKPLRLRGVSVNITERKRAEERFRLTVEASPNGIVLANAAGQMVLVNTQTEKLFGYPRAELIGRPVEILLPERYRGAHPGHRAGFFTEPKARAMGAGRELFARRKDGTEFPVEIGLNPIQTEEGPLVLTAIVDITSRKKAEAELAQQRNELSHLSRVTTVSELSGSLAHELNQPLGIILSNAQAAQELLLQNPPVVGEVSEILGDIVAADRRAAEIIQRLRSLLKRGEVSLQPLPLNGLIVEVLRLVNADLIGRGVTVTHDLAPDLPPVTGDRVQLQQLTLNLILNAADAMAGNAPGERRLHIATARHDSTVLTSVRDEGSGLPPDVESLFQPFFTTKPNGLGLGLGICRSIITAHQGRLWAEPHPERGAVFHFELPVTDAQKQP